MSVAWAAVGAQQDLHEDVLRHEHAVAEAGLYEARDVAGVILVAGAGGLLVGVEDLHADHVVLQVDAALQKARLVLVIVATRIGVAEHHALHRHPLRGNKVKDLITKAIPAGHVDLNRHTRLALREAGTGERVALAIGERLADKDLTNEAGANVRSLGTDGEVAHDAVGDLAHAAIEVLWPVHGIQEDAAPHDDVQPRLAADACEPLRVAPVPLVGAGLQDRAATLGGEALHLNDGGLNVIERAVVLVEERVVAQLPHVGDGDLLVNELL